MLSEEIYELVMARLVDPAAAILGTDLHETLAVRAESRANQVAADLTDPDKRIAAEAVISLAPLLPDDPDPEWWRTEIGMAIGHAYEPPQTVGPTEAARILGVTRGRIYQLRNAGQLQTSAGGLLLSSVLDRLANTAR